MKSIAIHFGAGALGRGLTIPFLVASGYDVVAVDADLQLIDRLQTARGYDILLTDIDEQQHIPLAAALHPADPQLQEWLAQATVITTSVRKENLHHVALALKNCAPKTVICCENIEQSGAFFASLLQEAGVDGQHWSLPDCMVDRICSSHWPKTLEIEAESYGSICVQALENATIPDKFEITENIAARFQEKRILVNTYADGISFIGRAMGLEFLYQAAADQRINHLIDDYMQVMKIYLQQVCHLSPQHLDTMEQRHRQRLANTAIKRPLDTVARNFLAKITAGERFIYPLIELARRDINIDRAIPFVNALINGWAMQQENPSQARQQALNTIENTLIIKKLEEAS